MQAQARGDRRQEATAGVVIAGAVLVLGWASGFGIISGTPFAAAQSTPSTSTEAPVLTDEPFTQTGGGTVATGVAAAPAGAATTGSTAAGAVPAATAPTGPAPGTSTAPGPTTASPAPATPATPTDPSTTCSTGAASAALEPLMTHIEAAHLQTSPGQQVSDLLNVDDYVKAHTVLVDSVLTPLTGVALAGTQAADPLMTHLEAAHLQTSPGQQVSDLLNVDDYVKAHTVLVDSMLAPAATSINGSCG